VLFTQKEPFFGAQAETLQVRFPTEPCGKQKFSTTLYVLHLQRRINNLQNSPEIFYVRS
jgi:hypothetical protein